MLKRRHRSGRTVLVIGSSLITLLGLTGVSAAATTATTPNQVYTACLSKSLKVVYAVQVGTAVAKPTCLTGDSVVSWNQVGPQGAAGAQGPAGLPGATGDTGAAGAKGDTGPAGAAGAAGDLGPAGPAGAVGPAGAPGAKGDTGADGVKGDTGATGDTGPAGAAGAIGPAGATGAKGDTGATGDTGPAGAAGAIGPAGASGAKGDTGAVGVTGAKGDTGAAGPKGDTGATGPAGGTPAVPQCTIGSVKNSSTSLFVNAQEFLAVDGYCLVNNPTSAALYLRSSLFAGRKLVAGASTDDFALLTTMLTQGAKGIPANLNLAAHYDKVSSQGTAVLDYSTKFPTARLVQFKITSSQQVLLTYALTGNISTSFTQTQPAGSLQPGTTQGTTTRQLSGSSTPVLFADCSGIDSPTGSPTDASVAFTTAASPAKTLKTSASQECFNVNFPSSGSSGSSGRLASTTSIGFPADPTVFPLLAALDAQPAAFSSVSLAIPQPTAGATVNGSSAALELGGDYARSGATLGVTATSSNQIGIDNGGSQFEAVTHLSTNTGRLTFYDPNGTNLGSFAW